ncbi:SDR family NAD(P)-dependent oxidoreductase [Actinoplanes sp. NPDC020271]|uniref:SDR family NAD(P)-dependent oxidoreductase n=1 Tax=Actinoplanes sp. NPDC020271 TaxID=3363896 RepID=UPI0037BAAEE3
MSLALVTGASSGIGKAFAERLAAAGHDLVVVGRRTDRLKALAASLPAVAVDVVTADLATGDGVAVVAGIAATRPLDLLVNNAGVAHYMPFAELPVEKARELMHVKVTAPTLLSRAAVPGMIERGAGTIVNVAGMLAFSGPAPAAPPAGQRAVYVGTLACTVAMAQTLRAELDGTGVTAHVLCPGIVATEFHEVQGMDLSALPRMSADDVVTGALAGIALGETVIAPGVHDAALLDRVFAADLAAFGNQSPQLAARYRDRPRG